MSDFCEKLTYKYLSETELPQVKALWAICFPEDNAEFIDYYFKERVSPENVFGAFYNEKLVSMLCRDSRRMFANGQLVSVCFVSGVATDPCFRNRGIVRMLLEKLDADLIREGFAAALLQPFSFDFYKKLGYEVFARRKTVIITQRALNDAEKKLEPIKNAQSSAAPHCLNVKPERPDAALILGVYNSFFGQRNGVLQRSVERCEALAHEFMLPGACSLCVGSAYALWYLTDDELTLHEFAFENAWDALALLREMVKGHSKFTVELPCDYEIFGIPCETEAEPLNMIKILNSEFDWLRNLDPMPFDVCAY